MHGTVELDTAPSIPPLFHLPSCMRTVRRNTPEREQIVRLLSLSGRRDQNEDEIHFHLR